MGMTFDEARHFLSRTGFGGTPDEIRSLMRLDRDAAVGQALTIPTHKAQTPPPSWIDRLQPPPNERKHWSEIERKAFREARKQEGHELKSWWYRELLTTRSPLLERMTLLWHNHFTSSLRKAKWPPFLYQQNVLFRLHALGSFRTLLHAVAKNPAMLLYLDTQTSHKEHPNENFAREWFELFTLGEGHRLANLFRQKNYDIAALLNALLLTPHFWAPENRGCLIKSPVDLTIGTTRLFNLPIEEPLPLVRYGRRLDRTCLILPTSKGGLAARDGLPPRASWTGRRCCIVPFAGMKLVM